MNATPPTQTPAAAARPAAARGRALPRTPRMPDPHTRTPAQLESDIRRTRECLDEKVHAVLFELKPTSLLKTTLGGHSTASAKEMKNNMIGKLRRHPMILSALVTGVTSLLLAGDEARPGRSLRERLLGLLGSGGRAADRPALPRAAHAGAMVGAASGSDAADAADAADPRGLLTGVRDKAVSVAGTAADTVSSAAGTVASATGTAAGTVTAAGVTAGKGTATAGRVVAQQVKDNPLLIGAGAVAAGLLLGALLPRTRQETALLGDAGAARMKDRGAAALSAAGERLLPDGAAGLTDGVKQVAAGAAAQAKAAAADAVERRLRGESHGGLAEGAKQMAAQVADAARQGSAEASREQELHPEQLWEQAVAAGQRAKKEIVG